MEARRVEGAAVVFPLVYGSVAFFLGKKAAEGVTHRWSIYLRGLEDEDLSWLVRRVVFTLHPSCQVPVVTCEAPPFVVTQTGWGEFDCKISLILRDEAETVVDIIHQLRLYPPGVTAASSSALLKKPVVNEHYEEVIFHEPSEQLHKLLLGHKWRRPIGAPTQGQSSSSAASATAAAAAAAATAAAAAAAASAAAAGAAAATDDPQAAGMDDEGDPFVPTDGGVRRGVSPEQIAPYFSKISEVDSMRALVAAQGFVSKEIERTVLELAAAQEQLIALRAEQARAQTVQQDSAASALLSPTHMTLGLHM
jgi:YEATS domain-containing protein 4